MSEPKTAGKKIAGLFKGLERQAGKSNTCLNGLSGTHDRTVQSFGRISVLFEQKGQSYIAKILIFNASCPTSQPSRALCELRSRGVCRAETQQLVELGRAVTDPIGCLDQHVPARLGESPSLGDGDDGAQPDRCRRRLSFGCVDNEGHGSTFLRDARYRARSNFRSSNVRTGRLAAPFAMRRGEMRNTPPVVPAPSRSARHPCESGDPVFQRQW